jgi:hypothetical protein
MNEPKSPQSDDKLAPGERVGNAYPHDRQIWDRIENAVLENSVPLRDVLEAFPTYIRRYNMTRFLAHYELYKKIADLPGSIVECGIYRGAGLFTWAKLLEIFHAGDRLKKVIGFDNFAGFAGIDPDKDGREQPERAKVVGGWNAGRYYKEIIEHIEIFHADSFMPRAKRIEVVAGNLSDTAPQYVSDNPGLRIALLNLDVDVYEPTKAALEAFYPHVVQGGIVIFDEYGAPEWGGESTAVEEYFGSRMPRLQRFQFSALPCAFMVKE